MASLSFLIQLFQCKSTGTESGNGGQCKFKREIVEDLFFKLSRNNWHGTFFTNIQSESRENENKIFLSEL